MIQISKIVIKESAEDAIREDLIRYGGEVKSDFDWNQAVVKTEHEYVTYLFENAYGYLHYNDAAYIVLPTEEKELLAIKLIYPDEVSRCSEEFLQVIDYVALVY